MANWLKNKGAVKGLLLDIFGVLFDEEDNGPEAIPGSIEAINKLNASGIPYRLCSNTSTKTKEDLCETLTVLGFQLESRHVFPPAPAACRILQQRNMRPHLLIDSALRSEFAGLDQSNPNCVVVGDATNEFTYENMNQAFRVLLESPEPFIISLGGGKYYIEKGMLVLDAYPYAKALEFATNAELVVVGKPERAFFQAAIDDMNLNNNQVVMIGDDIESDVGGAQASGIMGVQVRTGKYRPQDEPHPRVTPDGYVNNLLDAVNQLLTGL